MVALADRLCTEKGWQACSQWKLIRHMAEYVMIPSAPKAELVDVKEER
jgi:hypothetical protein